MPPHIRPLIPADKPVVMRFLRKIPEFKPEEVVVAEELIDYFLEDPKGSGYNIFVAEADKIIVGYVCYGPTPLTKGTWDIYWVAVDSRQQGHGYGKALMRFAEGNIKAAEGRLALIETASKPEYDKTRRFYESQGYELISRIPDFYEPGDDKLTLQRKL